MTQITVEVAYAGADSQTLLTQVLPVDATLADAIECSGILSRHPEIDWPAVAVGIFGRKVGLDTRLCAGDRIEIYRPLRIDPKERRRARARNT